MAAASSDPLFLPDLPRVKQQTELNNLRALFLQLMRQGDAQPDSFPGSQPVSFERRHMNADQQVSLQRMGFYASEKTDGMRYMLLVLGERGAYAVDRRFEFIKLPAMHFPARGGGAPLDETLLDGELVLDAVRRGTEEGTIETRRSLRYLAYDACAVSGTWLMDKPLPLRLLALQREVLGPRYEAGATGRDLSSEPFAVDQKDFFSIRHLQHIFQQVKPGGSGGEHLYAYQDELRKVEHGNDGVIFTPILEPYVCGTRPSLLRDCAHTGFDTLEANMNSIDFQLRTEWRTESETGRKTPRFSIRYAERGSLSARRYDWLTLDGDQHKRFVADSKADRRVIECVWDPEHETITYPEGDTWDFPAARKGGWKYERMREDKELPNDIRTVRAVEQSAQDGVEMEELLRAMG